MEFILIDENILEQSRIRNDITLNSDELWKIVVNRKLIQKLMRLHAFSIQLKIWKWMFPWEEPKMLWVVKELAWIADSIDWYEDIYDKFIEKNNETKK